MTFAIGLGVGIVIGFLLATTILFVASTRYLLREKP